MKKLPTLTGKSIYLRALCDKDAEGRYPQWLNDPEVTKYNSHGEKTYTYNMALAYIKTVKDSPTQHVFAIIHKETQSHIGNISIQAIDFKLQCAEFAILIGEPSVYGKGIGHEAGTLILDYGLKTLNLRRIYCGTAENNTRMQALALKLGMKEKHRRIKAFHKNGIYLDVLEYEISQE
jgi:RimJ/RimL family protein N-acetyltransferase